MWPASLSGTRHAAFWESGCSQAVMSQLPFERDTIPESNVHIAIRIGIIDPRP